MQCPVCSTSDTKVVDSRAIENGSVIRRRRICPKCDHRFSTLEQIEILRLMVVKKDGRREQYVREKMENGIRKALEKRPVPESRVREVITDIERTLQSEANEEISSRTIGSLIMRHLKSLDEVAYIRFASVYKSFKDAETFGIELERLRKESKNDRQRGKNGKQKKRRQ